MKFSSVNLLLAALAAGSVNARSRERYQTHVHAPASRGTHRFLEKKTASEKAARQAAKKARQEAKAAKAAEEAAAAAEAEDNAGDEEDGKPKLTKEEKAAAKEARLAAKAAKKAAKEAQEVEDEDDEDSDEDEEGEEEEGDKPKLTKEEKAAKKAEREAKKAAKAAKKADGDDGDEEGGNNKPKLTKEEKAAKAAKKAEKQATKEARKKRKPKNMPKKKAKEKKVKPKKEKKRGMMMNPKKKKQLPDNCHMESIDKEVPCPPAPPISLPKKCAGVSASWSGDPHFKTFDGIGKKGKYDCQGEGEFHVVKSLDSDFNLQGRFVKFLDNKTPTVTKSVVFDTGDGEPIVQVNVPSDSDNGCSPYLFLDGEKATVEDDKTFEGVRIKKTESIKNSGYIFHYEKTDVQLQVYSKVSKSNGCVLAAELCIPDCYHRRKEDFVGLLGTPDGDPSNDWRDKNGNVVPFSDKSADEYAYCTQNWCIDQEADSLFEYEEGQSFDSLNKCSDKPETGTEDCVNDNLASDPPSELSEICGDSKSCLLDGCLGGPEVSEDYVRDTLNMVDKNCGTEILGEGFDENVDTAIWGGIMEIDAKLESESTSFLQFAQGSSEIQNTIDIPVDTVVVVLEFLFYEIGGWKAVADSDDNNAYVFIGEDAVDLGSFAEDGEDEPGDVSEGFINGAMWQMNSVTEDGDLGFGSGGGDKIHKVTVKVPATELGGIFKFGFSSVLSPGSDAEGAGIDDLRITAFKQTCSIDCDGAAVAVEDFEESDQSDWGSVTNINGGHTILGPLFDGSDPIAKAFEVSPYAESAQVEFELYEVDDWEGDALNKFLVRIGSAEFDLGLTLFSDEADTKGAFASGTAGDTEDIYWERTITAFGADLGVGTQADDKIHKVLIIAPKKYFESGTLFVGFDVEASNGQVAAGLDDFKITVFPDKAKCEDAKQEAEENLLCPTTDEDPFEGKKCYKKKNKKVCSPTIAPNDPPTEAPVGPPTRGGPTPKPSSKPNTSPAPPTFITGDPHIRKWNGETYDFHGGCDLVLISDPDFNEGQGLYIHVRTKITRWWSSIESAAIKIGNDVLEIKAGIKDRPYWYNYGNTKSFGTSMDFPFTVGGFSGRYRHRSDRMIQYKLFLSKGQNITIRSVKDMLRVELEEADKEDFGTSFGLMGTYGDGELVGRDGTVFEDLDAFGNEWQVNSDDPQLFHSLEGPQFPEKCAMPSVSETSRRLGSVISHDDAEHACVGAGVPQDQMTNCIYDIQAMDDVDAALNY